MQILSRKNLDDGSSISSENEITLKVKNSKSLANLQDGLKACKNEVGFFNPMIAFSALNEIQKMEDPKAYQPEI